MYTLNLVSPDGQTIDSFNIWPSNDLSKEQTEQHGSNFYDLSNEERLNELGNQICERVETHFDSVEGDDNVTSELGEIEEVTA